MTDTVGKLPPLTLVLGGMRSGKSRHAESLISAASDLALYIATAEARDPEMAERIRHHQGRRDPAWTTVEAPLDLAGTLRRQGTTGHPILVDCLTLWLSNLMEAGRDLDVETGTLLAALREISAPVVMVSNEVGLGIVPVGELTRRFADAAGRLNQAVAARADRVIFVAAGLPLVIKDTSKKRTLPA